MLFLFFSILGEQGGWVLESMENSILFLKASLIARWLKLGFFEYTIFLHGYHEEDLTNFTQVKLGGPGGKNSPQIK